MNSRQAIIDFANLLTIGLGAIKGIMRSVEPAARAPIEAYIAEIDAIAVRLDEIGRELEKVRWPRTH